MNRRNLLAMFAAGLAGSRIDTRVFAQQQAKDPHAGSDGMPPPVATFSILGYDPETGEVGGAVQSRVFTLTGVLTADADAGVVATQAIVDVSYGPKGIALEINRIGRFSPARQGLHRRNPKNLGHDGI